MRRVFLILMIALLPVRGWAADMMGVVMAAQELSAVQRVAGHASEARSAAPVGTTAQLSMAADCPMWASQTATDDVSVSHTGCTTCQLCMALFIGHNAVMVSTAVLPQAAQGLASMRFTSAERAPGFKPPIS